MPLPSSLPTLVRRSRLPGRVNGLLHSSPVDTIAQDSFTDTNGVNLTAHTMNIGAGWEALAGTMTIASNTAECQSGTTTYVTQCNRPDVTVSCRIKAGAANGNFAPSIILRAFNNNNYLQVYFAGTGVVEMYQKVAGSLSLLNTGGVWAADTSFHTARVICESTHIIVYLDDVIVWEGDVPTMAGGTKFEVLGFISGGIKDSFDDFQVSAKRRVDTFPGEFISNSFTDPFTQSDGTLLSSLGWTAHNGTWEVNTNKARQTLTAAPANGYVVSRDIGILDYGLEVAITTPASGAFICGIAFRIVDRNHYIEAELNTNQGGFGVWYTKNSGAYIELARQNLQAFTPAVGTTYTMRVRVKGSFIIAELVEASIKLVTYCNEFTKATRVGLFEFRSGTYLNPSSYDNFKVYQ